MRPKPLDHPSDGDCGHGAARRLSAAPDYGFRISVTRGTGAESGDVQVGSVPVQFAHMYRIAFCSAGACRTCSDRCNLYHQPVQPDTAKITPDCNGSPAAAERTCRKRHHAAEPPGFRSFSDLLSPFLRCGDSFFISDLCRPDAFDKKTVRNAKKCTRLFRNAQKTRQNFLYLRKSVDFFPEV